MGMILSWYHPAQKKSMDFCETFYGNSIYFLDKFMFDGVLFLYQKEKERKRSSVRMAGASRKAR